MAPHLLSFSARARQEQEALKVALANGDGASLKSISERLVHRQGPGALQLLMRKLASNAEALAFWQQPVWLRLSSAQWLFSSGLPCAWRLHS